VLSDVLPLYPLLTGKAWLREESSYVTQSSRIFLCGNLDGRSGTKGEKRLRTPKRGTRMLQWSQIPIPVKMIESPMLLFLTLQVVLCQRVGDNRCPVSTLGDRVADGQDDIPEYTQCMYFYTGHPLW
jgi:hypothetical protein